MGTNFSNMVNDVAAEMANKKGENKMKTNIIATRFWIHVYNAHDSITKAVSKTARSMVNTESGEAAYNSGRKEAAAKAMVKLLSSTKGQWRHAEEGGFHYILDQSLHGIDGTGYQTFGGFIIKRTGKDGKVYATIDDDDWTLIEGVFDDTSDEDWPQLKALLLDKYIK